MRNGEFLSTPSARRATHLFPVGVGGTHISIHALREEGDWLTFWTSGVCPSFLSTPSARRATAAAHRQWRPDRISIHALREEGDRSARSYADTERYFYPRPPRGGRLRSRASGKQNHKAFLSTPSARRATSMRCAAEKVSSKFLSTPSARRATWAHPRPPTYSIISIHALREEGDPGQGDGPACTGYFYPRPPRGGRRSKVKMENGNLLFLSTPSARRATLPPSCWAKPVTYFYPRPPRGGRPDHCTDDRRCGQISIHALREEGDPQSRRTSTWRTNFYPRPPRGGRLCVPVFVLSRALFLSTPSARRATVQAERRLASRDISIHALREEGDISFTLKLRQIILFLSTPSARRATGKKIVDYILNLYISIHALREEGDAFRRKRYSAHRRFLSTPSARRATSIPES